MSSGRRAWQAAAAAWAVAILVTGLLPTQEAVETLSAGHGAVATTAGHFAAYLLLGFLLGAALGGLRAPWGRVLATLAVAAVLGGVIEAVQGPLPYRDAQISDFFVNLAGAATGLALFSVVARAMRPRSHRG